MSPVDHQGSYRGWPIIKREVRKCIQRQTDSEKMDAISIKKTQCAGKRKESAVIPMTSMAYFWSSQPNGSTWHTVDPVCQRSAVHSCCLRLAFVWRIKQKTKQNKNPNTQRSKWRYRRTKGTEELLTSTTCWRCTLKWRQPRSDTRTRHFTHIQPHRRHLCHECEDTNRTQKHVHSRKTPLKSREQQTRAGNVSETRYKLQVHSELLAKAMVTWNNVTRIHQTRTISFITIMVSASTAHSQKCHY